MAAGLLAAWPLGLDGLLDHRIELLVALVLALAAFAGTQLVRGVLGGRHLFDRYAWYFVVEGGVRMAVAVALAVAGVAAVGELAGVGPRRRKRIVDPWLPKIEEWVERSHAKIHADRAFDKLKALGFEGSDRTVRRAVAEVKANHRRGRRRVYRRWIPEPGMWAQWDWGAGPVIAGRATSLFCAWLAWSRFRVVVPCWDRRLATVIGCVDRAMRAFGGAAAYWLTDNERTVTIDHVAGLPARSFDATAPTTPQPKPSRGSCAPTSIVIDDIGLLPVAAETAEALYRVVDAAYEKRSIALSSNLHPAGFDELMPKTIANATVDRLLHHAHVVLTAGDSIRLTQATAGKGGDATDQLNRGQICWPRTGSSAGHGRAVLLSATGQIPMALDRRRSRGRAGGARRTAPTTPSRWCGAGRAWACSTARPPALLRWPGWLRRLPVSSPGPSGHPRAGPGDGAAPAACPDLRQRQDLRARPCQEVTPLPRLGPFEVHFLRIWPEKVALNRHLPLLVALSRLQAGEKSHWCRGRLC